MRRRLRLLLRVVAVGTVLGALVLWAAATLALRSRAGQAWVTTRVETALREALADGTSATLAGLVLVPLGELHLDSLVLRDASDAPALVLRDVAARIDLRALWDRELLVSTLSLGDVELAATQATDGAWNLAALLRADTAEASASPAEGARPWRIRLDTLTLRDGRITVTRPDSLPSLPPRRLVVEDLRLAVADLRWDPTRPVGALRVSQAQGRVESPALALALDGAAIAIEGSRARLDGGRLRLGDGRIAIDGTADWQDSARAPRFSMTLDARELALADLAWADPRIPDDGTLDARIRVTDGPPGSDARATITRFALTSGASTATGQMTVDVGDSLALRDLDITLAPLELALIRRIVGPEVPPDPWAGALRGRIRGPGGPLSAFTLAASTVEFEDRRVGDARSRLALDGTLNLAGDETILRALRVRLDSVDVRTLGAVSGVADSLRGYLTGGVLLEGPVSDLRFRELDLLHVDGLAPRSHLRGAGRIAEDTARTWLEATLAVDTLALGPLVGPIVGEPMRGTLHGQLQVSARGDSVALDVALRRDGAALAFVGATSMDTARLVARGVLEVQAFDASQFLAQRTLPEHRLWGRVALGIDGPWDAPTGPVGFTLDTTSVLAGLAVRHAIGGLDLEPGGLRVDTLHLALDAGAITAQGRLSRDPALRDTLRFEAMLQSLPALAPLLGDSLATAWADSLGGTLEVRGVALGSLDTLTVHATLDGDSLRAGSYGIARMAGELSLEGVPSATHGLATFDVRDARAGEAKLHTLGVEATVREAKWVDASFRLTAQDTLVAAGRADLHYMGDSVEVRVDSLSARSRDADWTLARPSRLFRGPDRLEVDSLLLISRDGARFALSALVDSAGPLRVRAQALRVPLAHARFTGLMPPRVNGLLTFDAALDGTMAQPRLTLQSRLDSTRVDDREAPELALRAQYADGRADLALEGKVLSVPGFTVTAELPVDLALESRTAEERFPEKPIYVRLAANGTPLGGLEALLPGVRELTGGLEADIQVTGTWRDPEPRGILLVREGAFTVPALGTGFRDLLMDVSLSPDSILLQRVRLADERSPNDTASIEGAVVRDGTTWRADLTTVARNLRVIDDPRVAEADASWQLRLRGPLDTLVLGGAVTIPQANVFIGSQRRRALALAEDSVAESSASAYAPRLDDVRLRLGNEVRLRSPEANVQLTGEVAANGTLDAPDVRGEIFARRGTFRLDLGLLQRTFQVDSGLVRLNGPLTVPPTLDIQTSYTVRQADREDVKIGARLSGTVDAPRLTLSSGDLGTTASETEIISYLLFGAPSFVLDGQSASAVRLATAALVPSIGGAAERALGARLPFLSELQVVTVAGDSPRDFTLNSFEGLLNSFALTAGTQVGPDSYLRLSGGVCRGENRAAQSLPAWFGITGEYRPRERLSAEVSLTPGSAPCNRIGTFSQIYQLGLDLYRDWRW